MIDVSHAAPVLGAAWNCLTPAAGAAPPVAPPPTAHAATARRADAANRATASGPGRVTT